MELVRPACKDGSIAVAWSVKYMSTVPKQLESGAVRISISIRNSQQAQVGWSWFGRPSFSRRRAHNCVLVRGSGYYRLSLTHPFFLANFELLEFETRQGLMERYNSLLGFLFCVFGLMMANTMYLSNLRILSDQTSSVYKV
jgi:hypothetical protein